MPIVTIADSDELYRRFAANHLRRDGTLAPTAFMKGSTSKGNGVPDPQISVDLAKLTTPEQSLRCAGRVDEPEGRPNLGIAVVVARIPRGPDLSLSVRHAPQAAGPETKENFAHSLIEGNVGEQALAKCDRLAEEFNRNWLICPVGAQCRARQPKDG